MNDFTFGVLTFNHESYILEHLESIKYLIQEYGNEIFVDIIINDDCSHDKTTFIIDRWLKLNSKIFRNITKIFCKKNIGTCQSLLNIVKHTKTASLKITAGDDVYSCENLFKYGNLSEKVSILSGIPLNIIDGKLRKNRRDLFEILLTQSIYKNKKFIDRFTGLSNNNAPNIFYKKTILATSEYATFLSQYDVVEDWPTQIFIAENYPETEFKLIEKIFVYYRRTDGSIFIVANQRFIKDKSLVYQYLTNQSSKWIEKIFIRNRHFLFLINKKILNKILNLSFYLFLIRSVPYYTSTRRKIENISITSFEEHYTEIKKRASSFVV